MIQDPCVYGTSGLTGRVESGAVQLTSDDMAALAFGCALLGAGGGGDPGLTRQMAERALADHGPVEVLRLEELSGDALIVPCGLIGAPTVALERVWNGDEARILVASIERAAGRAVAALMPYEIGGGNGLLPLTWAARLGLPIADADGMGRAFPEMQQQSMHMAGISASPVVLTDGRDNTLVINGADNVWAERLVRGAAASLGGVCAGALYAMTGEQARTAAIGGSVSRALEIGQAILGASGEALERVQKRIGARRLLTGRVIDVERRTDGGFVRGAATFDGTGSDAGRQLRIEIQNEYLVALEDGAVRASVPDLICVLAADDGQPIVTERLRYGQHVVVVVAPGPPQWCCDEGLRLVGPRAFGYEVDWTPLGEGAGA